jgi:hypothetical protein
MIIFLLTDPAEAGRNPGGSQDGNQPNVPDFLDGPIRAVLAGRFCPASVPAEESDPSGNPDLHQRAILLFQQFKNGE